MQYGDCFRTAIFETGSYNLLSVQQQTAVLHFPPLIFTNKNQSNSSYCVIYDNYCAFVNYIRFFFRSKCNLDTYTILALNRDYLYITCTKNNIIQKRPYTRKNHVYSYLNTVLCNSVFMFTLFIRSDYN